MKNLIPLFILLPFTFISNAQTGKLDPSFGNKGMAILSGTSDETNSSIAIDNQGRILLAGTSNGDMFITRFSNSGQQDNTFGNNGSALIDLGSFEVATDIIVQDDQKILVCGGTDTTVNANSVIIRLDANGSMDANFGDNGVFEFKDHLTGDRFFKMNLLKDGKILALAGLRDDNNNFTGLTQNVGLVKLTKDGVADTTFGERGFVHTFYSVPGFAHPDDFVIQNDGKILVAADYNALGVTSPFMLRFLPNGEMDTATFGRIDFFTGTIAFDFGTYYANTSGLGIQSNGKIIVSGTQDKFQKTSDFLAFRIKTDGSLDSSFNNVGFATTDFFGTDDASNALVMDGDDFLVLGSADSAGKTGLALVRYKADGQPDISFGDSGKVFISRGITSSIFSDGFLNPGGYLLTAGIIDGELFAARVTYNGTTGIDGKKFESSLEATVFPNPVNHQFALRFYLSDNADVSINLIDAQGMRVKSYIENEQLTAGNHLLQLQMPAFLKKGAYFIEIVYGSERSISPVILK